MPPSAALASPARTPLLDANLARLFIPSVRATARANLATRARRPPELARCQLAIGNSPPLLTFPRVQTQLGFLAGGLLACLLLASGCSVGDSSPPGSVSGTIETDEARVATRYGGRVEKVFAQEGDPLAAGRVIVELDRRRASCQTR